MIIFAFAGFGEGWNAAWPVMDTGQPGGVGRGDLSSTRETMGNKAGSCMGVGVAMCTVELQLWPQNFAFYHAFGATSFNMCVYPPPGVFLTVGGWGSLVNL